ncbi:hypothetical protein GLOTRDRAFT_138214 [Gloeophyllum trabeum ATCC 11539]|uniref:F-box domain-containing protein n=1 Tax=Gloeophyllum trabeum (strain ATCC 11539 / FP-39264 / Madison 617) TaxID=670483 RepID=S7RPM7_GLOTA|nr:uncharacterized protein GLOTRDRAFT_138214 [Gloeophyllum trabeum ATCC 11539]EPQ56495.1 hypothetical protein GLOTRDRAFT_138214 [Gloeophyllum trabeum ATCC 11539]
MASSSLEFEGGGDHVFSCLPPELWLKIAHHLCPSEEWLSHKESKYAISNMSLACRYFCDLCRPVLFSDMRFTRNLDLPPDFHINWYDFVLENHSTPASLASYVRSYMLYDWRGLSEFRRWGVDGLSPLQDKQLHLQVLSLLPQLQNLCLSEVDLDIVGMQVILDLPALHSLAFERCKFFALADSIRIPSVMVAIKKFTFCDTLSTMDDGFDPFIPAVMAAVASPSLRIWKSDDLRLTGTLCLLVDPSFLEDMTIRVNKAKLPLLSKFLLRTPSIHKLHITHLPHNVADTSHDFDLPQTGLPDLRDLQCPLYLLPLLVPNRPIRRLHINGIVNREVPRSTRYFDIDLAPLAALAQATSTIEDLTVPMTIYDNVRLEEYIPAMDSLTISDDRGLPMKIKSHNPKVKGLNCKCYQADPLANDGLAEQHLDLRKQKEWLTRLCPAFPDAVRICVTWSHVHWRRASPGSTVWTPVVAERGAARRSIQVLAEYPDTSHVSVVDEDGCLAKLFLPQELTPAIRKILGLEDQVGV